MGLNSAVAHCSRYEPITAGLVSMILEAKIIEKSASTLDEVLTCHLYCLIPLGCILMIILDRHQDAIVRAWGSLVRKAAHLELHVKDIGEVFTLYGEVLGTAIKWPLRSMSAIRIGIIRDSR